MPQRPVEPLAASARRIRRPSRSAASPAPPATVPRRPAPGGTPTTARGKSAGAPGGRATPRAASSRSSGRLTGGDDHVLDGEPTHQDEKGHRSEERRVGKGGECGEWRMARRKK